MYIYIYIYTHVYTYVQPRFNPQLGTTINISRGALQRWSAWCRQGSVRHPVDIKGMGTLWL